MKSGLSDLVTQTASDRLTKVKFVPLLDVPLAVTMTGSCFENHLMP